MLREAATSNDDDGYLSSVERYDPTQNAWEAVAPMAEMRFAPALAVVDGKLHTFDVTLNLTFEAKYSGPGRGGRRGRGRRQCPASFRGMREARAAAVTTMNHEGTRGTVMDGVDGPLLRSPLSGAY